MPFKNTTGKPLYLDKSRTKVVEEGAEAAFLLVGPGGEVPDAEAAKYGLGKQAAPEAKAQPSPPENKAVESAPADKAARSLPRTTGR